MSQANVETFRLGVDAFNRRDVDALLELLDPEVESHTALFEAMAGSAVYRGHDGLRALFRDLADGFEEFRIEISEIRDLGDHRILAIGQLRGRGKESGAAVESPIGYVAEFKDGRLFRMKDYFDPEDALEAAGLPG